MSIDSESVGRAMPRGVKNVLSINFIIILVALWALFNMYTETGAEILIAFATWSLLGTLVFAEIVIVSRMRKAWAMLRALIYVVALLQALTTMVLTKDFFSLWGLLIFVGSLFVVIYLIGFRGYLNSDGFKRWLLKLES